MSGSRLVHLSAHKRCWGFGRPFADQVGELGRMQSMWEEENAPFMDQLSRDYGRRSKRYQAFREGLGPEAQRRPPSSPEPLGRAPTRRRRTRASPHAVEPRHPRVLPASFPAL